VHIGRIPHALRRKQLLPLSTYTLKMETAGSEDETCASDFLWRLERLKIHEKPSDMRFPGQDLNM